MAKRFEIEGATFDVVKIGDSGNADLDLCDIQINENPGCHMVMSEAEAAKFIAVATMVGAAIRNAAETKK